MCLQFFSMMRLMTSNDDICLPQQTSGLESLLPKVKEIIAELTAEIEQNDQNILMAERAYRESASNT